MIETFTGFKPRYGSWLETIGIILMYFASVMYLGGWLVTTVNQSIPVDKWFTVSEFLIGDDRGPFADPMIYYSRTINEDVTGTFVVSVYRLNDENDELGVSWCSGNGGADYKAGRRLPPGSDHLSWLMNRVETPCRFVPGLYYTVVNFTFTPKGYPLKTLTIKSNRFEIHE